MAPQLTDEERQHIAALCREGKSARAIAAEVGRSIDTVSRIASDIGHTFGHSNLARAHAARSSYAAEVRAEIAAKAAARAIRILEDFEDKQPVVVGGMNGAEVLSVDLDARAQRDRAAAAQTLARTVLDIAKLDEKADAGQAKGLLEQLVESMAGRS